MRAPNFPPFFSGHLPTNITTLGSFGNYSLPSTFDPNADSYEESVTFSDSMFKFDSETRMILWESVQPGEYQINIELKDEYGAKNEYQIQVQVITQTREQEEEQSEGQEEEQEGKK